jgi:putative FmdB family regulatory protein
MPLYEYQCDSCGEKFEVLQKFSDEPLTVHELCGGAVHRLLTAPTFQFKGTGWYATDYAHNNGNGSARKEPAEKKESTDSTSKTETAKTESKSEAPAKS